VNENEKHQPERVGHDVTLAAFDQRWLGESAQWG
jgi:hypothetical protein